jgi:hypothetical protein
LTQANTIFVIIVVTVPSGELDLQSSGRDSIALSLSLLDVLSRTMLVMTNDQREGQQGACEGAAYISQRLADDYQ